MTANRDENRNHEPLLKIRNLKMYFPVYEGIIFRRHVSDVKAVDGMSFDIMRGETLGLVGESGCGKSTTGRAILQVYKPTDGSVMLNDTELTQLKGESMRQMRRNVQMIFQDPYASLDPRKTVGRIVSEPLEVHNILQGEARMNRVRELLEIVGLNPYFINRYPHEFSGGQRQRIGIARALAVQPEFIICDEPISALDVSIQAQVINLLEQLQKDFGLTYLFIAHDLAVVRHISDRIAVMYLGKIVELTGRNRLYKKPLHPYSQALLSAVPIPDPLIEREREKNRVILEGDVPSPVSPPLGCNFCTRCPEVEHVQAEFGIDCNTVEPNFAAIEPGHETACHLYAPCRP